MKVLHLSPSYFDSRSVVGGGERYAYELAKAISGHAETVFLTFAAKAGNEKHENLSIEYLGEGNPWNFFHLLKWFAWADVIHCYQVRHRCTDFAVFFGRFLLKKIFVTDIGGGQAFALSYHFPILRKASGFLLLSEYSKKLWRETPEAGRPPRLEVIYGGVDTEKFRPSEQTKKASKILFVGRFLPHKGIDYLIDALEESWELDVVGTVYDENYFEILKKKTLGKKIHFLSGLSDAQIIQKYQEAAVTVQGSVYESSQGQKTLVPELLGLAALESMSCGTPVIVTNVASLPEIVNDGKTGFIVPPNDPAALREKIRFLLSRPEEAALMGKQAREKVLEFFTWTKTASRCLTFYHS